MTKEQRDCFLDLLWPFIRKDVGYNPPRVLTSWGNKTKDGLIACIERIVAGDLPKKEGMKACLRCMWVGSEGDVDHDDYDGDCCPSCGHRFRDDTKGVDERENSGVAPGE